MIVVSSGPIIKVGCLRNLNYWFNKIWSTNSRVNFPWCHQLAILHDYIRCNTCSIGCHCIWAWCGSDQGPFAAWSHEHRSMRDCCWRNLRASRSGCIRAWTTPSLWNLTWKQWDRPAKQMKWKWSNQWKSSNFNFSCRNEESTSDICQDGDSGKCMQDLIPNTLKIK